MQVKMKQDVDVEHYRKEGYLMVRHLFSESESARFKDLCKAAVSERGPDATHVCVFNAGDIAGELREAMCDDRMVNVAEQIFASRVEFLSMKPVYKSAEHTTASPWHQDWQYWGGAPKLSVWIALEPATIENGCLRVIPGSHLSEWSHEASQDKAGFKHRISEESLAQESVIDTEMEAGDALFFHDLLLHASHPNRSGKDRWSMIPTYRDATVPDDDCLSLWPETIQL